MYSIKFTIFTNKVLNYIGVKLYISKIIIYNDNIKIGNGIRD